MVQKKDIRDSRVTFTINPDIERKVREKVKKEKGTLSGVIVSLLEGWLSGAPLPGSNEEPVTFPSSVDIDRLKREILEDLKKEISTEEKKKETSEPVQSLLVHTGENQYEPIIEAPTKAEVIESHTNIPPVKEPEPSKRYEGGPMGNPSQEEREKLSDDIRRFKEDYQSLIDAHRKEHGLRDARKAMKELFGFTDSEVSTMRKEDASLTRKKYNEYYTLMTEARDKYKLV